MFGLPGETWIYIALLVAGSGGWLTVRQLIGSVERVKAQRIRSDENVKVQEMWAAVKLAEIAKGRISGMPRQSAEIGGTGVVSSEAESASTRTRRNDHSRRVIPPVGNRKRLPDR